MDRRENLRRLHTATHIVNYCAREVLGNHVWQNGSNLKPEFGTLDITHYEIPSFEEICKIEKLANDTIFANKKVGIEELDRAEAEQKYGYVLYQGGAIPMKTLRIVSIMDSDIEACGGIHMLETGGIGFVKIESINKIQDGVIRLKFVVRDFALDLINSKQSYLSESCDIFSVNENDLPKTCDKFFNEWKSQKKEIEVMKKELKLAYVGQILSSNDESFEVSSTDMGFLMEIFTSVMGKKQSFKLVSERFVIATADLSVEGAKKEINKGKFKIYVM